MSVDLFMKVGDLKGESKDARHVDEIDVLAWSWGLSQSGTTRMGPGAGAGKVSVQDLSFTKYIDKSSMNLVIACCNGKHYPEAKLTVRKPGDRPLEYLTITMKDCLITSVSTGGSSGEDRLTENVTINFASFIAEYKPQKPDGSADASVFAKWDIARNVTI
jgi:type VI secretion system secreted protein Hcp